MKRIPLLIVVAAGCARPAPPAAPSAFDELAVAVEPAALVAKLKKVGGAHFHGTGYWRVSSRQAPTGDDAPTADAVTTTTDVWLDARGHFRLVETNDQDGGREVVLHERDLSVGLRYGKMTRRPAQEPEPTRFLQEAVGAPGAAWDVVRRFAVADRIDGQPGPAAPRTYRLRPDPSSGAVHTAPISETTSLRKWRETIAVQSLNGEVSLHGANNLPIAFTLKARFTATRDGEPLEGELAVTTSIDDIGSTAPIAPPASEELHLRPRTILEERALLGKGSR